MVRSCSSWSAGQDLTEYSIQRALVATIEEAEHYVYIENQFFVSYVKGGTRPDHLEQVEVKIGCALLLIYSICTLVDIQAFYQLESGQKL